MKRKKIGTFRENIRRIFLLEAVIPVFLIAGACLLFFLLVSYYTVETSSKKAGQTIAAQIDQAVSQYSGAMQSLANDPLIQWDKMDTDQLVEIWRSMYQLTKGTGYEAQWYLLDPELNSMLPETGELQQFVVDPSCKELGILWEIDQNPQKLSICLTSDNLRTLCLGTAIIQEGIVKGYLVVTIPASEFEQLLTQVSPQTIITDANGWIYLANNSVFQDSLQRFERSIKKPKGKVNYQDHYYYITTQSAANGTLLVYSITDNDMRIRMNRILTLFTFLLFFMIVGITSMSSGRAARKTTVDIDAMAEAFEQVKKGNLNQHLSIDSSVEFQQIGEAYNMMLDGLKENIKEKKELAEHAAFAQVKQLEAQFNPHFLFNTLDNIRFMTRIDLDQADKMIVALSNLLRYSINTSEEELTVREDLEFTQSYLNILKIRFNRRLSYELDVDEEIKEYLIPKLLIQPLLENAVKYGYGGQDTLKVLIQGYRTKDCLVFKCIDDGAGIKEEMLHEITENLDREVNRSSHYGIYNIHRRIRLMYGAPYGVLIISKEGMGTTLTLCLPIREVKREGESVNVESSDRGR